LFFWSAAHPTSYSIGTVGSSWESKNGRAFNLITHVYLVLRLRKPGAISLFHHTPNVMYTEFTVTDIDKTHLATWSRVLPEKLTGPRQIEKFPVCYGNGRFITAYHKRPQSVPILRHSNSVHTISFKL